MATRAYILIETAVGKSRTVSSELRDLDGVETVDSVTGRTTSSRSSAPKT